LWNGFWQNRIDPFLDGFYINNFFIVN